MMARVLFTVLVLLGTSDAASAHHRRRGRPVLVIPNHDGASSDLGAKVDSQTASVPPPPPAKVATFVDGPSARVESDLVLFQPTLVGVAPSARARTVELFGSAPAKKASRFYTTPKVTDDLDVRREDD